MSNKGEGTVREAGAWRKASGAVAVAAALTAVAAVAIADDRASTAPSSNAAYSALARPADAPPQNASRYADFVDVASIRTVYARGAARVYLARGADAGEVCRVTVTAGGAAGVGCWRADDPTPTVSLSSSAAGAADGVMVVSAPDGATEAVLPDGTRAPVTNNVAVFEGRTALPASVTVRGAGAEATVRLR